MADSDDEDTPHFRRPRSHWGDDQRASTASERRARAAHRSQPRGVPVAIPDAVEREFGAGEVEPEITKPWDMLDREQLRPDELEIVRRSKRDSNDPVVFGDLAKVTALQFRHIKELLDDRSTRKEQANAILELIKHPPNEAVLELQEDVRRLWRAISEVGTQLGTPHTENKWTVQENIQRGRVAYRWGVKLAGLALSIAIASVGFVVASIRSSAADEVLREQARKDIEELQRENKELRRDIERRKDTSQ